MNSDKRHSITLNVGITSSEVSEKKTDIFSEEKDSKFETFTEETKFEAQKGTTVESDTKQVNERKESIDKSIDSLGRNIRLQKVLESLHQKIRSKLKVKYR